MLLFLKNILRVFLIDIFSLRNSAYIDEIPYSVTFYLGLHCLQYYQFMSF